MAPVNAKPRFLMNNPRALKITASAVNTRWGITIAVAKPEPICSAVDAPLPAAPDQYVAEYIRYSTPNINEISRHLLNFWLA